MTRQPSAGDAHAPHLFRALIESSDLLIASLDPEGRVQIFNPACERLSGRRAGDLLGQAHWTSLFPAGEQERVRVLFAAACRDRPAVDFDSYWETPDGRRHWIHWRHAPLRNAHGPLEGVVATGVELTARKLVEDTLRQSEQHLRLLFEHLPGLVVLLDRDLRYQLASSSHRTWFGLDPGELWGSPLYQVFGAQAAGLLEPCCKEALTGAPATWVGELPFAAGGSRFVHGSLVARRTAAGEPDGLFLLFTDLTEHKLMERALDSVARRARSVLDTAVDGIITIDERGIVESFNAGAERLFGYTAAEVVGRNVSMLMPPAQAARHDGYLSRYLATGERHIIGLGREVTGRRRDGSEFPLELSVGEFTENGRHFFTGFTRDVSERKSAEAESRRRFEQLAHVTRLSSMGNLAAGIAHEVNQPLTAIVAMTQATLRNLRAGRCDTRAVEETLEKIALQGERASAIIQHMREFIGKDGDRARAGREPAELVHGVVELLLPEMRQHGVDLCVNLDDGGRVDVSAIQIEQVLVNLIQNAIQAMEENSGEKLLRISGRNGDPRGFFQICVGDNGAGLPGGDERRVFDAFFTTRPQGMGQGLAIARSIIEAHGGAIWAVRNDGPGATFCFTLPLAAR